MPKYNFSKADWIKFDQLSKNFPSFDSSIDHNETNSIFTNYLIDISNQSIPLITYNKRQRTVPWWTNSLSQNVKLKHSLSRRLDRLNQRYNNIIKNNNLTLYSLVNIAIEIETLKPCLNKISAIIRKALIENRRSSWRNYVTNLPEDTTNQKLWHKYRKISGSMIYPPRSPLLFNGTRIHDLHQISNIIGHHLETIGNSLNLDNHFREIKHKQEKIILNFETSEELIYNTPFTIVEFEAALNNCRNSAQGKDNISFCDDPTFKYQRENFFVKLL